LGNKREERFLPENQGFVSPWSYIIPKSEKNEDLVACVVPGKGCFSWDRGKASGGTRKPKGRQGATTASAKTGEEEKRGKTDPPCSINCPLQMGKLAQPKKQKEERTTSLLVKKRTKNAVGVNKGKHKLKFLEALGYHQKDRKSYRKKPGGNTVAEGENI